MAAKVLGPKGSQRRRRFLIVPILLVACAALFWIAGAQGVHDTGAFELDGNAVQTVSHDWDQVCFQVTGNVGGNCGTTTSAGATAASWRGDGLETATNPFSVDSNATIFTGGGSKDPRDINQWAWKDGAGGLPDKDNLQHSFAARYSLDPTDGAPNGTSGPNCPNGTGLGSPDPANPVPFDPTVKCEVLFFGSDRLDNSGDAQQGFWFFQNRITLGSQALGGGQNFNGVHKDGDVLIISDFSNGGTTSTISVYVWDHTVSGNLRLLQTSTAANCGSASAGDAFCGIVNPTNGTPAPWPFTDKSGFHTYLQGELYEGGINLSSFGLGNECFSSVASETRSSTSTTATLKDFVLGQLGSCGASLNTHVSTTSVDIGSSLTDSATVHVTGPSSPPAPTGTVSFFVCGPSATTCDTSGTAIDTKSLPGTKVGNDYTVTSASFTPNAAGTWCFAASWPGDTNYVDGPYRDDGTNECFTVNPRQPAIVTHQTPGPLPLGSSISDTADLSNTAPKPNGDPAGGTITFKAYGPQADPANPVCTGTAAYTSSAYPVSGNNTYPTAAQIADPTLGAASFTPTLAGQYNWVATYSGDPPNTLGVASGCGDEPSTIISLQPTMDTAQSFYPNDSATLGVAAGAGNIKGSVRFRLYTAADCSGTAIIDQTVSNIDHASPVTVNTTNTTVAVSTTQHNLSWLVQFTSTNSGIKNVTSACHNENSDLTIDNGTQSNTP